jgi:hypothetical protein
MLAPRTLKTAPSKTGFIWLNVKEPHCCTTFRTKRTYSDCHRTIGKMDHWNLHCPGHFHMGIAPRLGSSQLRASNNTKFDQMAYLARGKRCRPRVSRPLLHKHSPPLYSSRITSAMLVRESRTSGKWRVRPLALVNHRSHRGARVWIRCPDPRVSLDRRYSNHSPGQSIRDQVFSPIR